jgi:2-polyprenyl-3-methyl-5-hydroxy-6-metoxy-1,4-benzoquinol methylase
MIDFEAELDRLAADLAVLDVACGAGTRVNWRLEALAAIWALDQVELHTACGAAFRRYARVDYRLETILHINALRIARFQGTLG